MINLKLSMIYVFCYTISIRMPNLLLTIGFWSLSFLNINCLIVILTLSDEQLKASRFFCGLMLLL